jgi:hypothetical protein
MNEDRRRYTFRNKEASIIVVETSKENIVINQGKNSKGLHHKEDHSL